MERMLAPRGFEIDVRASGPTTIVRLTGELDCATTHEVSAAVGPLCARSADVRKIVLDTRGLTFMDARGLSEMLRHAAFAHENGHTLAVVRGPRAVQRLFELTGTDRGVSFVDDPAELTAG